MIIYPNNKEDLNLQQQVQKNHDDIVAHYQIDRTLADYGIRIIGFYDTITEAVDDLGDPYEGPYGNAVGIGLSAPYNFYIWTRANNLSEVDYWQNVGELAVVGPQGPSGEVGPQGPAGENAKVFTGRGVPTISVTEYSVYIDATNGDVYKPGDGEWILTGNIRGPQGLTGPQGQRGERGPKGLKGDKGDTGDPGGFIKISGFKVSEDDLPLPTELQDLEAAFLVGADEPYDLWIQVGTNYENAEWHNIGVLNLATYVTVNGEFQNIWDADTKLDRYNYQGEDYYILYGMNPDGNDVMVAAGGAEIGAGAVAMYDGDDCLTQDTWPTYPNQVVNKDYIDGYFQDTDTITVEHTYNPNTYRDYLKLHINAELLAQINKAIVTPAVTPNSSKTVPVYDRATGNVTWTGTTSFVAAANSPRFAQKTSTWSPQTLQGQTYEIFGYDANTPTFDMTLTLQDGTNKTISDLSYARVVMITTNWLYVMAYSATQLKTLTYVKAINGITKSKVFAMKYNSGTVL